MQILHPVFIKHHYNCHYQFKHNLYRMILYLSLCDFYNSFFFRKPVDYNDIKILRFVYLFICV